MIAQDQLTTISPQAWLENDTRHFNLWCQAAFLMLSLFAITLLLWSIDTRQLDNASVWAKPLKFESSLAMYFITLALLAGYLPEKKTTAHHLANSNTHSRCRRSIRSILYSPPGKPGPRLPL